MNSIMYSPPISRFWKEHGGKEHGDNWEVCYCPMYGNIREGDNIVRDGHIVHNSEHKVIDKRDYEKLMTEWIVMKSRVKLECDLPSCYTERPNVTLNRFPDANENATIPILLDVCFSMLSLSSTRFIDTSTSGIRIIEGMPPCVAIFGVRHGDIQISHIDMVFSNLSEYHGVLLRFLEYSKRHHMDTAIVKMLLASTDHTSLQKTVSQLRDAVTALKLRPMVEDVHMQ